MNGNNGGCTPRKRILLVDDHPVARQGLRGILQAEPDLEIIGEAGNGDEAVELAKHLTPDIVVMDIAMPGINGIEATRRILALLPHTRILVLSMHKDPMYVREAIRAGAKGYVLKDASEIELLSAIRCIKNGQGYISPAVSDGMLRDYRHHVTNPVDLLSVREREILTMLAQGNTNKVVANSLSISVHTVDAHRGRIMEKLDLHGIGDLVRFAVRNGVID